MQADDSFGIRAVLDGDQRVSDQTQSIEPSDCQVLRMRQVVDFACGKVNDSYADGVVGHKKALAVACEGRSLWGKEPIGDFLQLGCLEIAAHTVNASAQAVGHVDGA